MVARRDRALVLKRTPFGESSLVVQVLAREHGRVALLAKGCFRTTSRYFAVLDLFDGLDLEWSISPRSELGVLRTGEVRVRRPAIAGDLARYRVGVGLLELVDLASRSGQPEHDLCLQLETALDRLQAGGEPPELVRVAFELALLNGLGLAPALEACASCAGEAPPVDAAGTRAAFSAGAGGRLCRRCAEEARAGGRRVGTLPLAVLEDAAALASGRLATGDALRLERVRALVERFLGYHLEARPKSS